MQWLLDIFIWIKPRMPEHDSFAFSSPNMFLSSPSHIINLSK